VSLRLEYADFNFALHIDSRQLKVMLDFLARDKGNE
jgi:hypothetical protein